METDLPPPHSLESLVGAGVTTDDLRQISRWTNTDDTTLTATASDYAAEDAKLQEMLEKGRLGLWWQGIVSAAKNELQRRLNGESESDGAKIGEDSPKVNGTGINGHITEDEDTADENQPSKALVDSQGDVVME